MISLLFAVGLFQNSSAILLEVIVYKGRFENDVGQPVSDPYDFRFSLWSTSDYVPSDIEASFQINTSSDSYGGWQEEHVVDPDEFGQFSVDLGSITPLPDIDFTIHKYLQIEVKPLGAPDTDYQLMDFNGDGGVDELDRRSIGLPYAVASQRAITSYDENFTIDPDDIMSEDASGSIKLRFGSLLDKFLEYNLDDGVFRFSDSVDIQGDLTLSGTINGVNLALVGSQSHIQNTDTGTDSDTFEINTDGNGVILNTTGLTGDRTLTFDDADTVVVGTENTQTLNNKTIDGDTNTIRNIDWSAMKDREKVILISPEFKNMTIHQDGSNNMASLSQGTDDVNHQQYYVMTSQQNSLHDLDLHILVPIPDDFVSWQATPIELFVQSTSTDVNANQIDISVDNNTHTPIALTGGSDLVGSVANTWEQKTIQFTGTPTFTPGESMLLKVKMQAHSNNRVFLGYVKLKYVGK